MGPAGEDEGSSDQDVESGRADELAQTLVEPQKDSLGDVCLLRATPARELGAGDGLHESSDGGTRLEHWPDGRL